MSLKEAKVTKTGEGSFGVSLAVVVGAGGHCSTLNSTLGEFVSLIRPHLCFLLHAGCGVGIAEGASDAIPGVDTDPRAPSCCA